MNIRIALTNLGKYNEGELVYTWLELPATGEEIDDAMMKIGVEDGTEYEEYFITDYEAPFSIGEYTGIDELNNVAETLESLDIPEAIFDGTYDAGDVINFANELCNENIVSNADEYVQDIIDDEQLDEMVANEAKENGWQRVKFFLGGIDFMNDDFYYINGYGNVENLSSGLLDSIMGDLMDEIKREFDV